MRIIIFLLCFVYLLIIIELWQKKRLKTAIRLGMFMLFYIFWQSFIIIPSLHITYSFILYLEDAFANNFWLMLLWVIINLLYFLFVSNQLLFLVKKKYVKKLLVLCFILFYVSYFAFLVVALFQNVIPWFLFLTFLILIYMTAKVFLRQKKNYFLIIFVGLLGITYYSFFTYEGAVRLRIALMGYPISAYNTGFEELIHLNEKNVKQFYPIKNIPVQSGDMGIILVKNYFGIKVGRYVGF